MTRVLIVDACRDTTLTMAELLSRLKPAALDAMLEAMGEHRQAPQQRRR
jgi:hypothetical protein